MQITYLYEEAAIWLKDYLKDGAQPIAKLKIDAKKLGYSRSTLSKAADKLGVLGIPWGGGARAWKLPYLDRKAPENQETEQPKLW